MNSVTTSRRVRVPAILCAIGAAVAATLLAASPASAAAAPAPTATAAADHCMIVLPSTEIARCFATFEEAQKFAAGTQVGPPKGGSGAAGAKVAGQSAAQPAAFAAVNLTLIGIEYDWTLWNPLGGSLWVFGTGGPCSGPIAVPDYQLASMPAGWNNRISSFQTFSNCWAKRFDLINFGGLAVGYQGSQAIINAALNNDTSSEQWS